MPRRSAGLAAAAVLAQWVAVLVLVGWTLQGLVLGGLAAALVALCGEALAGFRGGVLAAAFWVLAPADLRFWRADFRPHWHHEVLPVLYGEQRPSRILTGILLLGAVLAIARASWVAAGVFLVAALAVARPSLHWGDLGTSLDRVREVGWSRRLVEYLPVAGLVGLALRRPRVALPVGVLAAFALLGPLLDDRGMLGNAQAVVPGLPLYAVLVGCLVLLVPARR